jgi:hypothetical protein
VIFINISFINLQYKIKNNFFFESTNGIIIKLYKNLFI